MTRADGHRENDGRRRARVSDSPTTVDFVQGQPGRLRLMMVGDVRQRVLGRCVCDWRDGYDIEFVFLRLDLVFARHQRRHLRGGLAVARGRPGNREAGGFIAR